MHQQVDDPCTQELNFFVIISNGIERLFYLYSCIISGFTIKEGKKKFRNFIN